MYINIAIYIGVNELLISWQMDIEGYDDILLLFLMSSEFLSHCFSSHQMHSNDLRYKVDT